MIPTELITMGASGTTAFIFQMMANAQANLKQERLAKSEQFKEVEGSISTARKFQNAFVNITRRIIVMSMQGSLIFLLIAGMFVQTNIFVDVPISSFLGLFTWGGGTKIVTVNGLVAYPELMHMMAAIIGFYFGQGAAKRV